MSKKGLIATERNVGLMYGHINRFLNKRPVVVTVGTAHNVIGGTCVVTDTGFVDTLNAYAFRGHPVSEPRAYVCKMFIKDSPKHVMVVDKYSDEVIDINPGDRMFNDGQCMRIFREGYSPVIIKHMDVEDIEIYRHKIQGVTKAMRDKLYYSVSDEERSTDVFESLMDMIQQLESTLGNTDDCKENVINIVSIVNHVGTIKFAVDYAQFTDASDMNIGITYACTYADGTTVTYDSISKMFRDIMNRISK